MLLLLQQKWNLLVAKGIVLIRICNGPSYTLIIEKKKDFEDIRNGT